MIPQGGWTKLNRAWRWEYMLFLRSCGASVANNKSFSVHCFVMSKLCKKKSPDVLDNVLLTTTKKSIHFSNVCIVYLRNTVWTYERSTVCLKIAIIIWSCFFTKLSCHGNIQNLKGLLQLPQVWAKKWSKFRRNS